MKNKTSLIKCFGNVVFWLLLVLNSNTAFSVPKNEMILDARSKEIVEKTWAGYKKFFIEKNGRVMRPIDEDTVSEGQANAMLRAVWLGDKETFDNCYRWTIIHLSRESTKGDNLLAWKWAQGNVIDWMPASDADIDFALSLILAERKWGNNIPEDLEAYGEKAKKVLNNILELLTFRTFSGRLYLSPWILNLDENISSFPNNPSYYSPGHFRVFYNVTKDKRWEELINTTYFILNSISEKCSEEKGVGLIPDWCSISENDQFGALEYKNSGFGWDAVRVPLRIAMDYYWFGSKDAEDFFNYHFTPFIEKEWINRGEIFCEYSYGGKPVNKYENPLFYAAYYCALDISGSVFAIDVLDKVRMDIVQYDSCYIFYDNTEYFTNSLAWMADGFRSQSVLEKE